MALRIYNVDVRGIPVDQIEDVRNTLDRVAFMTDFVVSPNRHGDKRLFTAIRVFLDETYRFEDVFTLPDGCVVTELPPGQLE